MISLQQVQLQRGAKVLLDHADLEAFPGQNIGLIGANGSGKSSLFKLILGQLQLDGGDLQIPKHWRISHMAQELLSHKRSAIDYVLDGDPHLRELQGKIAALSADSDSCGSELASLYADMEHIDGYAAESRAQQLLAGLGFKPSDDQKNVTDFSGGWRIRLNLARALMCQSDCLLLDEPTNHLDLDATMWLEQWLSRYPGTLLIISHDRDFLDNVVGRIVSFENGKLIAYTGNYSAYEVLRADRLAQQQQAFEKQQVRIAEIDSFVRRFKAKATKAKQAQSRVKELERMEKIAPAHIDSPFTFKLAVSEKISDPLLGLSQMSIGYRTEEQVEKIIIDKVNISIHPSTRLGLLGPNGAGKSSLVKTIAGTLEQLAGDRTRGEHLKIGYFAQHQLEALDLDASAALHIQRISPKASEQEVRNFLGSFDFQGDRAFETIRHFSGGEKARLALAIIAWHKPNLLLLDEPTNHLDIEMRHALTLALQMFEGAVILVSHDRHLLRNSVDQFLLVADGRVENFDGDLHDYQRWLADNKPEQNIQASAEIGAGEAPANNKKEQRQQAAELRKQLQPLNNQLKKCERELDKWQTKLSAIEDQLADSEIYSDENKETLKKLLAEQSDVKARVDSCEEEWFMATEELEELKAQL